MQSRPLETSASAARLRIVDSTRSRESAKALLEDVGGVHTSALAAPHSTARNALERSERDVKTHVAISPRQCAEERREVFGALWEGAAEVLGTARPGRGSKASAPQPAAMVLAECDDDELPTRALLRLLGDGVGKKEASKLRRNREEALG